MRSPHPISRHGTGGAFSRVWRGACLLGALGSSLLFILSSRGQSVQHLSEAFAGGMPGAPVITGVEKMTNGLKVTWDGPPGYYQLFESSNMVDPKWVAIGRAPNLARAALLPAAYSNDFFRVAGPGPKYGGSQKCVECHSPVVTTARHTAHAIAFNNTAFASCGGQTNALCLACHTVGFDLPTGFANERATPQLADVQCENCHGPASPHAANPDDPLVRPRAEIAATVCGGCHTGPQNPTFDEWETSAHASQPLPLTNAAEIDQCGRCHSGAARLSLLEGAALPVGDNSLGIVCITCHDPHQTNAYPAQLRYPIASTNDYSMPINGAFATSYNPRINVCAQCHNRAGASWTDSSAAPHHSPQYDMLLGAVGIDPNAKSAYHPGSHAVLLTNQCVACHMQSSPFVSDTQPAVTGHSFKVDRYDLCLNCHPYPEQLVSFATGAISNQIQLVKSDLDYWAARAAPTNLWDKYGNLSWEYTAPGELSEGGPGPNAAEQKEIPENIQKARFNLYIVLSDGSFGVHNPYYAVDLLNAAEDWIEEEVDSP